MTEAIGIMGGTFDPVHYGHLMAAEFAHSEFHLDKVILMLAARPPHKKETAVLSEEHRLEMLKLAIGNNHVLEISDLELNRPGYSYTIDTIKYLRSRRPEQKIYFIMGSDALFSIHTWKDINELSRLCRFIVVTRPGYRLCKKDPLYERLPAVLWENTFYLEIPGFDLSSTEIRKRVYHNKPIKYLVPPEVEQYIKHNGLYRKMEEINA